MIECSFSKHKTMSTNPHTARKRKEEKKKKKETGTKDVVQEFHPQCCQKKKRERERNQRPGASGSHCDPSCSGGRDWENHGSRMARQRN
jgi:hypothetical protein